MTCLKPATQQFARFRSLGRAAGFLVDVGQQWPLAVYVVYGWPRAATARWDYEQTTALIDALLGEIGAQPETPFLFMGDFNLDASKHP
eukprot:420651-Alexandrium_andersonii.AAC.1